MLLLIFLSCPPPQPAGSVATTTAADTVDFEEMATEQNRCAEMQRLLGGTSLKLAFRQTGVQRLADDISTIVFHPIVPLQFRKIFLTISMALLTLGGSALSYYFI